MSFLKSLKRFDRLVLGYALRYFAYVLPTLLFIFIIQYLIKYFDEFVGKGLSVWVFIQLISYFAVNLMPLAVPLSVMLMGLITYGSLGEHAELTIMKSVGVSPFRLLRPVFVLAILFALFNYYLAAYIAPIVNVKAFSLLHDIRRKKPSFRLEEKEFYQQIPGYSLRYEETLDEEGLLGGVMIYDHSASNTQSARLIMADSGYLAYHGDTLFLSLKRGSCYTESPRSAYQTAYPPISHTRFEALQLKFDLSSFSFSRTNETYFQNVRYAKNIDLLMHEADSLAARIDTYGAYMKKQMGAMYAYHLSESSLSDDSLSRLVRASSRRSLPPNKPIGEQPIGVVKEHVDGDKHLMALFERHQHYPEVIRNALYKAEGVRERVEWEAEQLSQYQSEWRHHTWAIQNCFALAASCIIMFLIGAPLGVIVKKGGLGVPGITSTCFFIVFHVTMVTCNKYAREGVMDMFLAAWMANIVLACAAIFVMFSMYRPPLSGMR